MNAQEARKLTDEKILDGGAALNDFMRYISSMAKSGNDFASVNPNQYKNPEQLKADLEALGYNVTLTEGAIRANW